MSEAPSSGGKGMILAYLLSAYAVMLLWQALRSPGLCGDEFIWDHIGRQWCEGVAPYTGLFENKNPGIFYIHYLSNLFFGASPLFGRSIAIVLQLGAVVLIYDIAFGFLSAADRLWCMAVAMVLALVPSTDPIMVGATESFMYPFTVLGFWLYLRLPATVAGARMPKLLVPFLSGAAVGMAIVFKQVAVASLLALMCWPLFTKDFKESAAEGLVILAGALMMNVLAVLPVIIAGASVQQYLQNAWISLFGIGRFSKIGKSSGINWAVWAEWILPALLFCAVLARKRQSWPFLVWLLADFAGVNGSGDYFSHQFKQLIPAFALCGGWALSDIFKVYPERTRNRALVASMTAFFLLSAADNMATASWRIWSDRAYRIFNPASGE